MQLQQENVQLKKLLEQALHESNTKKNIISSLRQVNQAILPHNSDAISSQALIRRRKKRGILDVASVLSTSTVSVSVSTSTSTVPQHKSLAHFSSVPQDSTVFSQTHSGWANLDLPLPLLNETELDALLADANIRLNDMPDVAQIPPLRK